MVAQTQRDKPRRQAGLLADWRIGLFVQRDEIELTPRSRPSSSSTLIITP